MSDYISKLDNLLSELSPEQQRMLEEQNQEEQTFFKTIKECPSEMKKELIDKLKDKLSKIKDLYSELHIEQYEKEDLDILMNIDSEIVQLNYTISHSINDQLALCEFYDTLDSAIEYIEEDLDDDLPENVRTYAESLLEVLHDTIEEVLVLGKSK